MRKLIAAFATISVLGAAVYAQSLEKAAKRSWSDQQTEESGPGRVGLIGTASW